MKRIRDQIQERSGERKPFTEREVLKLLMEFLEDNGWKVKEQIEINGGRIDVGAEKEGTTLLVEVKGEDRGGYTSAQMNFQMGLGQLISRMKYRDAEYGLGFPLTRDFIKVVEKYEGSFAFEKLGIYLLPVKRDGSCRIISPSNVLEFLNQIESLSSAK